MHVGVWYDITESIKAHNAESVLSGVCGVGVVGHSGVVLVPLARTGRRWAVLVAPLLCKGESA